MMGWSWAEFAYGVAAFLFLYIVFIAVGTWKARR